MTGAERLAEVMQAACETSVLRQGMAGAATHAIFASR
jgi:hypothetical protein